MAIQHSQQKYRVADSVVEHVVNKSLAVLSW